MADGDAVTPLQAAADGGRDAFLSYASADESVATRVCAHLEAQGLSVWMAPRDVPAGAQYAEAIVGGINGARAMMLILSEHSVASPHVGREIERASSKHKPIISLRLDATPLPPALEYFLSQSQWVDARSGMPAALTRLTDGLARIVGATAWASPAPSPAPGPGAPSGSSAARRRQLLRTIAIVLASLVVLLGGWFAAEKYWWSRGPHTPGVAAGTTGAMAPQSIAVLPFTDLSEKKDQEYFSDGLSEELIDLLGKVPGLRVPARTSSFYFKGRQTTLADIGKALNVTHVLEGSVRKSGDALRITTELIAVGDDSRVWSETYDRKLDDVFRVQDDIAGSVVSALKVRMLDQTAARAKPTSNSEAYLHYLRSLTLNRNGNAPTVRAAIQEAEQAVALDPDFAEAWMMLGSNRMSLFVSFGAGADYATTRDAVYAALTRAVKLKPGLADAHAMLGRFYYMLDWNVGLAQPELDRALALEPNNSRALWNSAYAADVEGRFDVSIGLHAHARDMDPLAAGNYLQLGNAYYRAGRLEEAAAALRTALRLFPEVTSNHYRLGLVLLAQGNGQQALEEFTREQDPQFLATGLPLALWALGRHPEADAALARALADSDVTHGAAYQVAIIYAQRGARAQALSWLERALAQHDGGMLWAKYDPLLKDLASEPRFQAVLAAMHMQ
jgi:TolB-like protein/cytochrome c-type biogenesis protein CcmH/NrfG